MGGTCTIFQSFFFAGVKGMVQFRETLHTTEAKFVFYFGEKSQTSYVDVGESQSMQHNIKAERLNPVVL